MTEADTPILYGAPYSVYVRAVRLVLEEKGVPYRLVEVDDGADFLLSPGDVVIQNGTRHRWRVVGDVPATVAAVLIGARHL